ncbi:hypothetical protein [Streptomyces sp. NBC_00582]|uniref:hypothetical protein n=1 Tax=Streptomyces sp. NBC_00582 TaxID=2975783 RepID=UPI002E8118BA|nr:hypothetical protein [Streptomyces sp. NBC_00582]WUB68575.1 hypothetical protein OG852_50650 [Streptomyces sp. NBC_00582]
MTDHTTPARDSSSEMSKLRALNHRLVQALQAKAETPVTLLPLPQDGTEPQPTALVGVLLILWHRARLEADAYRAWIEQPAPPTDAVVHAAAESARAHLDHQAPSQQPGSRREEDDLDEHSRPRSCGNC